MASLCDEVGEFIDAASDGLAMDGRTGAGTDSGAGYGGPCFPKYIGALEHLALSRGIKLDLSRSVTEVNHRRRQLPLENP